jgi:hypothetical protein
MALIPPFFLDCVVAVGHEVSGGQRRYVATGFLFGWKLPDEDDLYRLLLITNKHVFAGHSLVWLRFNPEADEPAREFYATLLDPAGNPLWRTDPDHDIDIAVIGLNADHLSQQGIRFSFFANDKHVLSLATAKTDGVSEGDGVFALGFPMGIVGEQRNYVIVRQGAIARISNAFVDVKNDILVDITIFPGNSGGPVVTRPEVTSIAGTKSLGRAALLGVVSGYVPYEDVAVSAQTGQRRIVFQENSGLATVVSMDHVIRIVDSYIASGAQSKAAGNSETGSTPETA